MRVEILTNAELVQKLNLLVKEERKLSMEILCYLREVETRRLYAEMGYGSIYEFCIKELDPLQKPEKTLSSHC